MFSFYHSCHIYNFTLVFSSNLELSTFLNCLVWYWYTLTKKTNLISLEFCTFIDTYIIGIKLECIEVSWSDLMIDSIVNLDSPLLHASSTTLCDFIHQIFFRESCFFVFATYFILETLLCDISVNLSTASLVPLFIVCPICCSYKHPSYPSHLFSHTHLYLCMYSILRTSFVIFFLNAFYKWTQARNTNHKRKSLELIALRLLTLGILV